MMISDRIATNPNETSPASHPISNISQQTSVGEIQNMTPVMSIPPKNSLANYETNWRSRFAYLPTVILGVVQLILTLLILILEIVTLALSTYLGTGVGIWSSVVFLPTAILTFLLACRWERSRIWSTRVLIAQLLLIIFCFVLIGIVGDYVSKHSIEDYLYFVDSYSKYRSKYQVMQAQLAFGILLLFSGIGFVIFYGIVTYLALWKPFQTLDKHHLFHQ